MRWEMKKEMEWQDKGGMVNLPEVLWNFWLRAPEFLVTALLKSRN